MKAQITRGERIRALLTQPRFANLRLVDQVALLAALGEGVFDALPAELIPALRARLPAYLDANGADESAALERGDTLDDALRQKLAALVGALAQEMAP